MITTFKIFESYQTRNSDISIKIDRNKGNPDIDMFNRLSSEINYQQKDFKRDVPFIDRVRIYQKNGIKMLLIKWNHSDIHDFKDRIRTRTQIRSVSEFNDFFEKIIKFTFSKKLVETKFLANYAIHLINSNYNIIIQFSYPEFKDDSKKSMTVFVKTVVQLPRNYDVIVDINEEEFINVPELSLSY